MVVEIEDDGKGIDPAMIRAKAVEKGLMTQERADAMPDDEAVDSSSPPGFSTAPEGHDISGRGVGMDVVRSNVRKPQRAGGRPARLVGRARSSP